MLDLIAMITLLVFMIISLLFIIIAYACCVCGNESKSDYERYLEDEEQMNYLRNSKNRKDIKNGKVK